MVPAVIVKTWRFYALAWLAITPDAYHIWVQLNRVLGSVRSDRTSQTNLALSDKCDRARYRQCSVSTLKSKVNISLLPIFYSNSKTLSFQGETLWEWTVELGCRPPTSIPRYCQMPCCTTVWTRRGQTAFHWPHLFTTFSFGLRWLRP